VKRDLNLLCQARNDAEIDVVNVDLSDRTYPIYIGESILQHGELLQKHVTSKKAMIVTNTKVGPLYSTGVRDVLERKGVEVFEVVLPDGEEYKTMDILMKIIDAAMLAKLDRKSTLIALGGGVIGDMTGVLMCYITFSLCIVILMSTSFFFQQNYL
jgi:3-dehydroquinate synthase